MEGLAKVWQFKTFLLKGTLITLQITFGAVIVGFILGILAGMARVSRNKILRFISEIYVTIIRGTPMLLQIMFIFVGFPQIYTSITGLPLSISPITAGIVGIGINSGAYVAEIVRAGIQSIDKGQMEAARSLGLSHSQTMRFIILPQAFKNVIPPLGNEFIVLLKDTSLVSAIGGRELMNSAKLFGAKFYLFAEFLLGAAIVYLSLTFIITKVINLVERRLGVSD